MSECKIDDVGNKRWYINGVYHREDGPAIKYYHGTKEWWLHGEQYTEEEFVLLQFTNGAPYE